MVMIVMIPTIMIPMINKTMIMRPVMS